MSVTIFVQTIEKYPCLYNNTLSEYARKDITDKAWNEVAAVMKWSVADCKERWKNIRNGFVRSLKQPPSGSSAKQKKQYYLHDVMQFVLPYVKPVVHTGTIGNLLNPSHDSEQINEINEQINEQSNEIQSEDKIYESTSESTSQSVSQTFKKPFKKIKPCNNEVDRAFVNYLQKKKKKPNNEDHRKMFLVSLLPEINKLSDEQMREFIIKVLMLLDEILTRPRQDQSSTQQIFSRTKIRSLTQEYRNFSPISSTESLVSQHTSTPSPNFTISGLPSTQWTNIDKINSDTSNITTELHSL